ncbi:MAG: S26 family signal peptidase [Catenulispora sp.]|nr:S26 family signal peptidase [Catenulispora sp.]
MMLGIGTALAVAATIAALTARRALVLITVSGGSMSPTYTDGEKLLVRRGGPRPRAGDVVVVRNPRPAPARPDVAWMVKRVVALPGDAVPDEIRHSAAVPDAVVPSGCLLVRGDNMRSLDSRHFGYVPAADVLGVSVRRRDPPQPSVPAYASA